MSEPTYSKVYGATPGAAAGRDVQKKIPTVFVALGGSGKSVMMKLRKRFRERFPSTAGLFDEYARFLFVDTNVREFLPDDQSNKGYEGLIPKDGEKVSCAIGDSRFYQVFDDLAAGKDSDHLAWLKPELRDVGATALSDGAGTIRQLGRLAFFLNYPAIRDALDRQIREVLAHAHANQDKIEDDRIEVVIATSLAGGTGAGMFIDMAYLVRDLLARPDYKKLQIKHVTVIGFLPDLWKQDVPNSIARFRQNAYAALLELEYYSTPRTGDELFLGDSPRNKAGGGGGAGFHVTWGGRDEYIPKAGWDAFFLIDNVNDLAPTAPLGRDEIFQMTADYLFLDFEEHRFATAKRSARSNLRQYQDRWKATWVRKLAPASNALDGVEKGTDNIFATQNSCVFSSFGLAEIVFDLDRLYQAAGYRLAWHLIRSRWIGPPDRYPDDTYRSWVKRDLLDAKARAGQETPPSLRPDSLARMALRWEGANWLDALEAELLATDTLPDGQAVADLDRLSLEHGTLLAPGGGARRTMEAAVSSLKGTPTVLGPLRKRLRDLVGEHLDEHGTSATVLLIARYREALNEIRERLRGTTAGEGASTTMARLREAQVVPFPARRIAMRIEVDRARTRVAEALRKTYAHESSRAVASIPVELSQYLGPPDSNASAGPNAHGTLHEHVVRASAQLEKVAARLASRFELTSSHDPRPNRRKQSLAVPWDAEQYDAKINEALVLDDRVGRGVAPADPSKFHRENLESQVFDRLAGQGLYDAPRGLDALVRSWFKDKKENQEAVDAIAEALAEACRHVLKQGRLRLDDVEDGNAVDILANKVGSKPERTALLEKMIDAASPYFPMADLGSRDAVEPAYHTLFGLKEGENPPRSRENAVVVGEEVAALSAARESGQAGVVGRPLEAEQSSILLVREMAGFPLQYYSRLGELYDAYKDTSVTPTSSNDVCHIDYHAAWESLPDVRTIDTPTYARIREYVNDVFLGMMVEAIIWTDDAFSIRVPDPNGPGTIRYRQGKQVSQLVINVCNDERVRANLRQRWEQWRGKATPEHWACLYASALRTWGETRREIEVQRGTRLAVPLRNCYGGLIKMIEKELDATDDGRRWLAVFRSKEVDSDDVSNDAVISTAWDVPGMAGHLRRINDRLPIYQVIASKVAGLQRPGEVARPEV